MQLVWTKLDVIFILNFAYLEKQALDEFRVDKAK